MLAPQQVRKALPPEKRASGQARGRRSDELTGPTAASIEIDSAAVTVGRGHANDIPLDDEFASTQHARLEARTDGVWLEDVGSTNGTVVNGDAHRRPAQALARRRDPDRRHRLPLRAMSVIRICGPDRPRPAPPSQRGRVRLRAAAVRDRGRDGRRPGGRARLTAGGGGRSDARERRGPHRAGARRGADRGREPERLRARGRATSRSPGMGTTMTVALVENDHVWIGHVGRLPCVPPPRRRARAGDGGPLARRRARPLRPADAGRGGQPSAPIRDHASPRDGRRVAVDVMAVPTQPERRVRALLGRLVVDGRRRRDPRRLSSSTDDDLAHAARVLVDDGERRGRRGQHHRRALRGHRQRRGARRDGRDRRLAAGRGDPARRPEPVCRRGAPHRARRRRGWGPRSSPRGLAVLVLGAIAVFGLSRAHFVGVEKDGARRRLPGASVGSRLRAPALPRRLREPARGGQPLPGRAPGALRPRPPEPRRARSRRSTPIAQDVVP